jgi:hypothetical protein
LLITGVLLEDLIGNCELRYGVAAVVARKDESRKELVRVEVPTIVRVDLIPRGLGHLQRLLVCLLLVCLILHLHIRLIHLHHGLYVAAALLLHARLHALLHGLLVPALLLISHSLSLHTRILIIVLIHGKCC